MDLVIIQLPLAPAGVEPQTPFPPRLTLRFLSLALFGLLAGSPLSADAKPSQVKARKLKRVARLAAPTTNASLDKDLKRLTTKINR